MSRSPAQTLFATGASALLGELAGRWPPTAAVVAAHAAAGKVFLAGALILLLAGALVRLGSATLGS